MKGAWHIGISSQRTFCWMGSVRINLQQISLASSPVLVVLLPDRIKVSDFGLSTVFRHLGKERRLSRRCGTPPYIAPEVIITGNINS